MNKKLIGVLVVVVIIAAFAFTQMGGKTEEVEKDDINTLTLEELQKKAQEEGRVESVGMPDSWANWVGTWTDLKEKYGIEHADTDMTSAEELSIFEAEKENATKDIGDVGQSFGPVAESKGLTLPYKTSYWDEIPEWAKDDNGDWIIGYYGTLAIITNRKLVPVPPKSFADILEGDYKVTLGDVTKGTQSQCAVLAAAIAYGGSEKDLTPGLEYFKKLAEAGRIDKGECNISRLEKGEIACMLLWDYNALGYREQIQANIPDAQYDICIPSDGSVQSGYATVINVYSKRPHAAAFAREYILSDAGQINLARGYATPIRSSVELPDDVKAKLLPREQYAKARPITDFAAWEEAAKALGARWLEEVMVYAK